MDLLTTEIIELIFYVYLVFCHCWIMILLSDLLNIQHFVKEIFQPRMFGVIKDFLWATVL